MAGGNVTQPSQFNEDVIRSGVFAWIAYDFINSLLIINGSLYYSAWLTQDEGVNPFWYGATFSISTVILLIILPFVGAEIDRKRNGRRLLFWISVFMGAAALSLPRIGHSEQIAWRVAGSLLIFGIINFLYQASLVAYNWILVHLRGVKTPDDVRRVSGLGEGAGSLGSVAGAFMGLSLLKLVLRDPVHTRIDIFLCVALIFFGLFFIDYWLLCRGTDLNKNEMDISSESYGMLLRAAFTSLSSPGRLRSFLLAFLLYADALLTVQLNLPIFMRERLGLSDSTVAIAFAISLLAATIGASVFALGTKRFSLKSIIITCLCGWAVTLFALGMIGAGVWFWGLMVLAGILFGVTWSASRAYLIELTPSALLGRTFGFYAVFERCASILGPLLWGLIMLSPMGVSKHYFWAFFSMALLVILAIVVLLRNDQMAVASEELRET